jgi:hypothetical protein
MQIFFLIQAKMLNPELDINYLPNFKNWHFTEILLFVSATYMTASHALVVLAGNI